MECRGHRRNLVVIFCLVIPLFFLWWMLRTLGPPGPWSKVVFVHPGPIHILTSNEEICIFLELDWLVRSPNPLASPRVRKIAHEQYVIMRDGAVIVDLANRDLTGEKYCSSVHFVDRAVRAAPERAWLASLRCLCHRTSYRDTSHDSCSIYSTHGPPPRLLPLDTHRNHPGMPRFPPPRPAVPLPTPVRP